MQAKGKGTRGRREKGEKGNAGADAVVGTDVGGEEGELIDRIISLNLREENRYGSLSEISVMQNAVMKSLLRLIDFVKKLREKERERDV